MKANLLRSCVIVCAFVCPATADSSHVKKTNAISQRVDEVQRSPEVLTAKSEKPEGLLLNAAATKTPLLPRAGDQVTITLEGRAFADILRMLTGGSVLDQHANWKMSAPAIVMGVLENDVLQLKGALTMKTSDSQISLVITGKVFQKQLQEGNTVSVDAAADLRIEVLRIATKPDSVK